MDAKEILAGVISLVISLIVIVAVAIPQIETAQGQALSTTTGAKATTWNFTGSTGAVALLGVIAIVLIAGLVYRAVSEFF